jgi:glycosyltransferase involved in cell wall biosynthesis
VSIIYNGIDLNAYNPIRDEPLRDELGIKAGRIAIGIIGVFDRCKGHIYLFEALKQLVTEGRDNIVCLVIGDGRERDDLKKYVVTSGMEDNVVFLGYRDDVQKLLKVIDIVVIPSLQESFPRVALEAMAMKLPVIATEVGGLPEAVVNGRTGIIIPAGDSGALSEAVKCLADNPGLRNDMGSAGRKRVEEKFSLGRNIQSTEDLYLELIGS